MPDRPSALAILTRPDFVCLLAVQAASTLASRGFAVVVGYQVFELTGSALALGMLGLVEAIPAITLALYGGHVADRADRRAILVVTLAPLVLCMGALALIATLPAGLLTVLALYGVVFLVGVARGFADPAEGAIEAVIVPREEMVRASAWLASSWMTCAVTGPIAVGFAYYHFGPAFTYLCLGGLYAGAWLSALALRSFPPPPTPPGETVWQSISAGVQYVWNDQVLLGSMALDLFAVLFGGAIALLPVFAKDILHVGPIELGFLNAATAAGALSAMLWATRRPPVVHAGRNILVAVAGFGVCMIVFALSENFYLSLTALFLSGVFDGISVVIRRAVLRLMAPEHLRGRIAAVSMIFISSSNELGALESGLAASALGTVRSVWMGGLVTLLVVALTAGLAPRLRQLQLDPGRVAKNEDGPE
jgi:MFS family permease